ncbi:orotidine-5'-phosphate decarboxylase [Xenorhabdus sp. 12]|uniref:Orotidine 5'-phosphate decarboxylase n=1 Tax=Xenorhabdus santafensis TaxID=2582833 RepID=A0ABU4S5V4_9GAMM|nr:orotidine-5'-phosphate decarboxylase [Xenorhabdus sp. 12]MDX7986590.1 orotidine-5'-phosphate decarboxylase [Xenorhabdus sp. 12]
MNFVDKINYSSDKNNSLLCIGIDPINDKLPKHYRNSENGYYEFSKKIIDSTHDLVCAYKPQIAHFSSVSKEHELEKIIDYIKSTYPDIPVILDAKRGDIGSTAEQYAKESFERYEVDAVTINPYLGFDSLKPFLDYKDKGIILLCRTSNPGAVNIQDLLVDGEPLYKKVASLIVNEWNYNNNCLAVVGATWPNQMKEIREIAKDIFFLVPGVGTQGGSIKDLVINGKNEAGKGLIISTSRAIIYASQDEFNFAEKARLAAKEIRDNINLYR